MSINGSEIDSIAKNVAIVWGRYLYIDVCSRTGETDSVLQLTSCGPKIITEHECEIGVRAVWLRSGYLPIVDVA